MSVSSWTFIKKHDREPLFGHGNTFDRGRPVVGDLFHFVSPYRTPSVRSSILNHVRRELHTFSLFISGIKGEVDIQYFPQICFVGNLILQDHFCHAHDSITEIRDVHVSFSGKIFVHWHSNISDLSFCTIE